MAQHEFTQLNALAPAGAIGNQPGARTWRSEVRSPWINSYRIPRPGWRAGMLPTSRIPQNLNSNTKRKLQTTHTLPKEYSSSTTHDKGDLPHVNQRIFHPNFLKISHEFAYLNAITLTGLWHQVKERELSNLSKNEFEDVGGPLSDLQILNFRIHDR
jgi:hypothetical protein